MVGPGRRQFRDMAPDSIQHDSAKGLDRWLVSQEEVAVGLGPTADGLVERGVKRQVKRAQVIRQSIYNADLIREIVDADKGGVPFQPYGLRIVRHSPGNRKIGPKDLITGRSMPAFKDAQGFGRLFGLDEMTSEQGGIADSGRRGQGGEQGRCLRQVTAFGCGMGGQPVQPV